MILHKLAVTRYAFLHFGYILGIWIIALMILIGGSIFYFKNNVDIFTYIIVVYLAIYNLFLVFNELSFSKEGDIIRSKSPLTTHV